MASNTPFRLVPVLSNLRQPSYTPAGNHRGFQTLPRDFKKLVTARFLFSFAVEMQAVIVGWRMYVLTHDPLHLGLLGLAEAVPALGIALYAGYLVDKSRPLLVYRNVVIGSFLSALVVLVSQTPAFGITFSQQIVALFVSSFLSGAARGFSQPAIYAAVPRIIRREDLPRASAWSTTALQIARISGPGVGGLIFGWLGVCFAAGCASAFLFLALLAVMSVRTSIPAPLLKTSHKVRTELFSGAAFVFRHPILLPALSLDMISVFFGGVTALLPIFAADILHVGPKGLGVLRAAAAIGALVTSLWLTRVSIRSKAGTWLFSSVAGFSLCILVFGLSRNFYLSLLALALSGAFDSVSMIIRSTAVQLASPEAMRGRISAINSIFIGSSNELGEFESGIAAKLMGTVPAVIFGGVVSLVTVGVLLLVCPALRSLHLGQLTNES